MGSHAVAVLINFESTLQPLGFAVLCAESQVSLVEGFLELGLITLADFSELSVGLDFVLHALVDAVLDLEDAGHDGVLCVAVGGQRLLDVQLHLLDSLLGGPPVEDFFVLSHLRNLLISICVYRLFDDCLENVRVSFAIHRHETFADLAEDALRLLLSLDASLVTEDTVQVDKILVEI